jgi:hypothetical protein
MTVISPFYMRLAAITEFADSVTDGKGINISADKESTDYGLPE